MIIIYKIENNWSCQDCFWSGSSCGSGGEDPAAGLLSFFSVRGFHKELVAIAWPGNGFQ